MSADGSGDSKEAADFGDVVVLATPHDKVFDAIDNAGGPSAFAGKVVVHINNPVPGYMRQDFRQTVYDGGKSLSEVIADCLPDAQVCKAFNCCQAKVWAMDPPVVGGVRLVTMFASNGDRAREVATRLIEAVGSEPLDVGELHRARQLEAVGSLVIQQLFVEGADPRTVMSLVRP